MIFSNEFIKKVLRGNSIEFNYVTKGGYIYKWKGCQPSKFIIHFPDL